VQIVLLDVAVESAGRRKIGGGGGYGSQQPKGRRRQKQLLEEFHEVLTPIEGTLTRRALRTLSAWLASLRDEEHRSACPGIHGQTESAQPIKKPLLSRGLE
jgi:hypothetical protein